MFWNVNGIRKAAGRAEFKSRIYKAYIIFLFEAKHPSETIPLDNAESKLLFSDDGVLAGLERLLLYIPIK